MRISRVYLNQLAPTLSSRVATTLPATTSLVRTQHLKSPADPELVNAPHTLPLPVSFSGSLLHKGKTFVKLYKTGIVNVWRNRSLLKELRAKYNFRSSSQLAQYIVDTESAQLVQSEGTTELKPGPRHISPRDWRVLVRTELDFPKLPIFAVVFGVFFETTPLLLALFPRLSPSTCYSPGLVAKDEKSANSYIAALQPLKQFDAEDRSHEAQKSFARSVYRLSSQESKALARALLFPTVPSFVPVESLLPSRTLTRKLEGYITKIRADNILLSRFGSTRALNSPELHLACLARGISTEDVDDSVLRQHLLDWMVAFSENHYDAGFFLAKI